MTPTEIPRLLSAKEAAAVLLTSEGALAALRYRGAGPKFRKLGHRVAYAVQDLRDYIDSDIRTGTATDATA
ncbi:helix-turn-helix transcriptional regulator [Rhodococcus erythropolis]|uniref:helix-turn-helix transcriptional regulator n=1 Tax=Rhodococcus erythropolis TaxID=1833 RepID=UPI00211E3596|nr:DNA-binding protein [Rhodococcus erythropolis]